MENSQTLRSGILAGVKVLSVTSVVAGPFAPGLFSEHGADVIHVENAQMPDTLRAFGETWSMEHRNQRTIALDVASAEGKKIITRLLKNCEIFFESSKARTWDKWGFTDEALWQINPALVIVHVSGYGQSGDPDYLAYTSYDPIGQAFSGFMALNGMPDPLPPLSIGPYACDYVTGLTAAWASLAALLRARQTGRGESIDVSQYESMARITGGYPIEGFNKGIQHPRRGNTHLGLSVYKCRDDKWIVIVPVGATILRRIVEAIGLDNDPDFDRLPPVFAPGGGPLAVKFFEVLEAFCQAHSSDEVQDRLRTAQIPCSKVMEFSDMLANSQYRARNTIIRWNDPKLGEIQGIGVVPKFSRHPGAIESGSPAYGMHNEAVLGELGYDEEEIQRLYEQRIINKFRPAKPASH